MRPTSRTPSTTSSSSSTWLHSTSRPSSTLAGQIQTLLLEETPLILPYWFDAISVSKAAIGGVVTTGMGQIFLNGAGPAAT